MRGLGRHPQQARRAEEGPGPGGRRAAAAVHMGAGAAPSAPVCDRGLHRCRGAWWGLVSSWCGCCCRSRSSWRQWAGCPALLSWGEAALVAVLVRHRVQLRLFVVCVHMTGVEGDIGGFVHLSPPRCSGSAESASAWLCAASTHLGSNASGPALRPSHEYAPCPRAYGIVPGAP